MKRLVLTAVGRDRPGIVAGVTEALLAHELNIEDSQMTILRGHFTMMLIVTGGGNLDVTALEGELQSVAQKLGLEQVSIDPVDEARIDSANPTHIVTVYGVDHPGIVHSIAQALADREVNITDLNTRIVLGEGLEGEDIYAMVIEVGLPAGLGESELRSALESTAAGQGVEVSVRELEQDAL